MDEPERPVGGEDPDAGEGGGRRSRLVRSERGQLHGKRELTVVAEDGDRSRQRLGARADSPNASQDAAGKRLRSKARDA